MKYENMCGTNGVAGINHCDKCAIGCYLLCDIFDDRMASEGVIKGEVKLLGPNGRKKMIELIEDGYIPLMEYAGYLYKDIDGFRTIMQPDYKDGYIVRSKKSLENNGG